MTTIVIRDNILAADTQISLEEESFKTYQTKIKDLKDGSIIASRGSCAGADLFEFWKSATKKEWDEEYPGLVFADIIQPEHEFESVMVTPDGKYTYYSFYGVPTDITDREFFATGSGAKAAYAAMEMGATAIQAVKIAMKYDLYSGGKVEVRTIKSRYTSKNNDQKNKKK